MKVHAHVHLLAGGQVAMEAGGQRAARTCFDLEGWP
jgi:hypothetical protein